MDGELQHPSQAIVFGMVVADGFPFLVEHVDDRFWLYDSHGVLVGSAPDARMVPVMAAAHTKWYGGESDE